MALTEAQKALGWVETTVAEFLGETPAESDHIEISIALSEALKEKRLALGLTQREAAKRLNTTQPNVARMEFGVGKSVTMDLLVKYLLELGCTRKEVATVVAGEPLPVSKPTVKPATKKTKAQADLRPAKAKRARVTA